MRCGGGRHPSPVQAQMSAGARLLPLRTSLRVASQGVVAADTTPYPGMDDCRRVPPNVASESDNSSVRCARHRHPSPSRHDTLPMRASHRHRPV